MDNLHIFKSWMEHWREKGLKLAAKKHVSNVEGAFYVYVIIKEETC